jgi:plastocyanin
MRGGIHSVLAAPDSASRRRVRVGRNMAIPIVLLLSFLVRVDPQAPQIAHPQAPQMNVIMKNYLYVPNHVSILPGDTVTWLHQKGRHSATSNTPLRLWDSGIIFSGRYSFQFESSGGFLYHCTLHFNMTGLVSVIPTASPPGGPVGTVFTITVASADASPRSVYDVQMKEPEGGFEDWFTGVTTASVEFDSTGQSPGRYQFRARLRKVSNNVSSLWSRPVSIQVDPAE